MRKTPRGWIQIGESRTRGVARIPLGLKPSRDSRATSQRDSPIWIQPLGVFRYIRNSNMEGRQPQDFLISTRCALLEHNIPIISHLTHLPWTKWWPFWQTTSNAFTWMKMIEFGLKFHWNLFTGVQLTISQHWFRWWVGAEQATRQYLN